MANYDKTLTASRLAVKAVEPRFVLPQTSANRINAPNSSGTTKLSAARNRKCVQEVSRRHFLTNP